MDWVPELSGSLEGKKDKCKRRNIKGSGLFNEMRSIFGSRKTKPRTQAKVEPVHRPANTFEMFECMLVCICACLGMHAGVHLLSSVNTQK